MVDKFGIEKFGIFVPLNARQKFNSAFGPFITLKVYKFKKWGCVDVASSSVQGRLSESKKVWPRDSTKLISRTSRHCFLPTHHGSREGAEGKEEDGVR